MNDIFESTKEFALGAYESVVGNREMVVNRAADGVEQIAQIIIGTEMPVVPELSPVDMGRVAASAETRPFVPGEHTTAPAAVAPGSLDIAAHRQYIDAIYAQPAPATNASLATITTSNPVRPVAPLTDEQMVRAAEARRLLEKAHLN